MKRTIFTYFVDPTLYHRALPNVPNDAVDVVNLSIGAGKSRPAGAPSVR